MNLLPGKCFITNIILEKKWSFKKKKHIYMNFVHTWYNYSAARLICTIVLYMCVLDTIYGVVTKKIAVGNLRKIIVTPKEDDLFLYIIFTLYKWPQQWKNMWK
jgi:hypothetical protein